MKKTMAPAEQERKFLDILDREKRLDDILKVLDTIHGHGESVTFALNGKWGVGKSFVLEMLEDKLKSDPFDSKYLVFHYNCWQYDFYEEPLVAILTALSDRIDAELHPLPKKYRNTLAFALEDVLPFAFRKFNSHVMEKYGVDLSAMKSFFIYGRQLQDAANTALEIQNSFDPNRSLNQTVALIRENLTELSGDRTIVVIVDELDRCLPEYAIKVMERLHHLFFSLSNTAVILSIDKEQLGQSIRQIFGEETEADDYLRKIINFEITLDAGTVRGKLSKKYEAYFEQFDEHALEIQFPEDNGIFLHSFKADDFISNLLTGIEIRRQEQLVNRCMTVHKLVFGTETKKDYSFLCAELFWIVLTEEYGYTKMPIKFHHGTATDGQPERWFYVDDVDSAAVKLGNGKFPSDVAKRKDFKNRFDAYLQSAGITSNTPVHGPEGMIYHFQHRIGIGELLIWYLNRMFHPHNKTFSMKQYDANTPFVSDLRELRRTNINDLEKFKEALQIIK